MRNRWSTSGGMVIGYSVGWRAVFAVMALVSRPRSPIHDPADTRLNQTACGGALRCPGTSVPLR